MSASVRITIDGDPRGKGSVRAAVRGKFASLYTDKQTRTYENRVWLAGREAMAGRPPFSEPVSLHLVARMVPPQSTSRKRRAAMLAGEIRPGKKPDLSNVLKAVEDGLNRLVFADDALIVRIQAEKVYADTAGVDVTVTEI